MGTALASHPPNQSQILREKYLEGKTNKQIAIEQGTYADNIRRKGQQALRNLRNSLNLDSLRNYLA